LSGPVRKANLSRKQSDARASEPALLFFFFVEARAWEPALLLFFFGNARAWEPTLLYLLNIAAAAPTPALSDHP